MKPNNNEIAESMKMLGEQMAERRGSVADYEMALMENMQPSFQEERPYILPGTSLEEYLNAPFEHNMAITNKEALQDISRMARRWTLKQIQLYLRTGRQFSLQELMKQGSLYEYNKTRK